MTQPKPVLCLGEALIDVVIRDDTRSEHVGGSPLNVACVITSLGRPALIGAWWGRDDRQDIARVRPPQRCRQRRVRVRPVVGGTAAARPGGDRPPPHRQPRRDP